MQNSIIEYMKKVCKLFQNIINYIINQDQNKVEIDILANNRYQELISELNKRKIENFPVNCTSQIRANILNECQEMLKEVNSTIGNDKMWDNRFFIKKIKNFIHKFPNCTGISKTKDKIMPSETLQELKKFNTNLEDFSKEIKSNEYNYRLIIDDICSYISSISKPGVSFDVNNIIFSFNLISKIFEPNDTQLIIKKLYGDFLNLFYSENPKYQRPNKSVNETFKEVLKIIQKENGLHFYVNVLFRKYIDDIINPNNSTLNIFTKFKESFKLDDLQFLDSSKFYNQYKIFFDKEIRFYMKSNNDISPLTFYPMGSLSDLLHINKYNFSNADKLTIIMQIATKIKDLHDLKSNIKFLVSDIIYLNSNLDAYIVPIDDNQNSSSVIDTILTNKLYYQAPEYISDTNTDVKIELGNIYSFGVLMFEILSGLELKSLMDKYSSDEIKQILKNEYFKRLHEKVIKETENYLLKQFEKIIEKCMKVNAEERYQSITEIIQDIEKLDIYIENEKEIKYRTNNCSDQCKLSDVIINYYQGNNDCNEYVLKLLRTYHAQSTFDDEFPITNFSDPITNIFKMFKVKRDDAKKPHSHDEKNKSQLISESLKLNGAIPYFVKESTKKLIKEHQKEGKYYYIIELFNTVIKNYLDDELFVSNVHELLEPHLKDNYVMEICDAKIFNGPNSSYKLGFDNKCRFYLIIDYNTNVKDTEKEREKDNFSIDNSKYIVHKVETTSRNKIVIPYFPFGTLKSLIESVKLNLPDKFVSALEIARGISELHDNNKFHGHLDSQCIFTSAKLGFYIASFCHDKCVDLDSSKPDFPFCAFPHQVKDVDEGKKIDIWSFGFILSELFTNKTSESKLPELTRLNITKPIDERIINCLYPQELNDRNEGIFDDIKSISQKCFNRSYISMNAVIDDINIILSSVSEVIKHEVSYRISHYTDSIKYECTLSDIFSCFYLKHGKSLDDIIEFFSFLNSRFSNAKTAVNIEGDMIRSLYKFFNFRNPKEPEFILDNVFRNFVRIKIKSEFDLFNNKLLFRIKKTVQRRPDFKEICPLLKEIDKGLNSQSVVLIGTLDDYVKNNATSLSIELIHQIAYELMFIHSLGLYHGELNMKTIAIYYDMEEKKIVSSIIYFYSFYKLETNEDQMLFFSTKEINKIKELDKKKDSEEYKRIDIKRFNSIIEALSGLLGISDGLITEIKAIESMDGIFNVLNNFFSNNPDWKKCKYSNL